MTNHNVPSREAVEDLAKHLESDAWRPDPNGDPDCYDEGQARAAVMLRELLAEVERLREETASAKDAAVESYDMMRAAIAERDTLRRTLADREAELASRQAHIDALMLEFCPDDMTPAQLEHWGRNQQRVSPEEEAKINAALASQPPASGSDARANSAAAENALLACTCGNPQSEGGLSPVCRNCGMVMP